ncbi:MAG: WD40/YVTN/BNR-like repeat-containing protein [Halobacteriales archaeon]
MPTVYVAMEDALTIAEGEDDDWSADRRLGDRRLECVAATPEVVGVGTFDAGLFRSTSGGHEWSRIGADRLPESVMSLAVSPHDPAEWWLGTEPSRVFRSIDAGATWTERPGLTDLPSADEWYFPPRPDTHHVRWIEVDPDDPDRLYLGIEAGAFVLSEDAGGTWRDRPEGARLDNHQLATHADAPGRVYSAAGDGYAESTDGGETWRHPQAGLEHRYVWSVASAPTDPDHVLVSAARGAGSAHSQPAESYVYRRTAPGGSWVRLDDRGLPTGEGVTRAMLASGRKGRTFYAANNRGLFRTRDGGQAWTRLPIDWPDRYESMTCRGLAVV